MPTAELVVPNIDRAEALRAHATRRAILGNKQVRLLLGRNALAHQSTFWRPGGDNDDASAAVTAKGLDALTSGRMHAESAPAALALVKGSRRCIAEPHRGRPLGATAESARLRPS